MRCVNYSDFLPAVQLCVECCKGLCQECMTIWAPPLCTSCASHHFNQQKQRAKVTLISLIFAFLLGRFFFTVGNPYPQVKDDKGIYFVIMGAISAGTVAGWRYLRGGTVAHNQMVWFSSKGYATFLVLRLVMSVFIGTLMLPFVFYRAIFDLRCSLQAATAIRASSNQTST